MEQAYPLLVAVMLGILIGLERKLNDHTAGIHTHALVALGAALFILLGHKLAAPTETVRMASQVVMGVGFLAAALVMRDGIRVRGVNTAATIWCSCAIGAIAGAEMYMLAAIGAVIVTITNCVLHLIEHKSGWFNNTESPENGK